MFANFYPKNNQIVKYLPFFPRLTFIQELTTFFFVLHTLPPRPREREKEPNECLRPLQRRAATPRPTNAASEFSRDSPGTSL